MDTSKNTMNVTGTGIAVALALIVVVGLFVFGPKIFTHGTSPVGTTASTTQTTTTMNDETNPAAAAPATGAPTGIPANVTQLMTKDDVVGTGTEAKAGDKVTVQYVGMLTDGTVFDASKNHGSDGFTFNLGAGQVIKGWDEGVVGMKVGGTRELVIPASLGYGAQAVGSIPANSTLVFQVQLINVQPGS